jgi:hypothetical protein
MAKKTSKELFGWKQSFFQITALKIALFGIIVMVLTIYSLKTTYVQMSGFYLFASALLNTLIIMLCYVFACAIATIFHKVGKR